MFNEFFKRYEPGGIEKLSKTRIKNIKAAVFDRIKENGNEAAPQRRLKFKLALIAATVTLIAATGVTVGALSSPPDIKMNGSDIEPYYNVYTDRDGSTVEIMVIDYPPELVGSEMLTGKEPVGELRAGRSEIGDVSRENYSGSVWLIDENGDEFHMLDNKLVEIKITYPDKVTGIYAFESNNRTDSHSSYGYMGNGYYTILRAYETDVCGFPVTPSCASSYDYDADAFVEILAMELPAEALGEPVSGGYFPSVLSGSPISGARLKFFDEEGNRIAPVITNISESQTFPDGVNDLLLEIKITYSDGNVEIMRVDPLNKLENFDYNKIEFKYTSVKFENMFENDHHWLKDENGNAVYQDLEGIVNGEN